MKGIAGETEHIGDAGTNKTNWKRRAGVIRGRNVDRWVVIENTRE